MRFLILVLLIATSLPSLAEKVALTFDDLPLNGTLPAGMSEIDITSRVLSLFASRKAPPIYGFINAKKLEGNPNAAEALRLWMAAGHKLGNHTYSHPDLSTSSIDVFSQDIIRNEPALLLLSPREDWRWLRYPYLHEGETIEKRNAVRRFLEERGYRIAQTTLDYEDYLWNSAYARCLDQHDKKAIEWLHKSYLETAAGFLDGQREMARMVFGREIRHVLLLHLGAFSPEILPPLLDLLKAKGFELATLLRSTERSCVSEQSRVHPHQHGYVARAASGQAQDEVSADAAEASKGNRCHLQMSQAIELWCCTRSAAV